MSHRSAIVTQDTSPQHLACLLHQRTVVEVQCYASFVIGADRNTALQQHVAEAAGRPDVCGCSNIHLYKVA